MVTRRAYEFVTTVTYLKGFHIRGFCIVYKRPVHQTGSQGSTNHDILLNLKSGIIKDADLIFIYIYAATGVINHGLKEYTGVNTTQPHLMTSVFSVRISLQLLLVEKIGIFIRYHY